MLCGFTAPSINGSPALTQSPSWTLTCLPFGMRYSLDSLLPLTTTTLMPLCAPLNSTMPSISVTIACSFGRLASNSSATLGRPPVISFVFVVSRGIFARISPGATIWFLSTSICAPAGSRYRARLPVEGILSVTLPCSSFIDILGLMLVG